MHKRVTGCEDYTEQLLFTNPPFGFLQMQSDVEDKRIEDENVPHC